MSVKRSPQLEGFRARGVEVLLLTDPIDEFWMPAIGAYKDKPFKSATRGGVDLDKIAAAEEQPQEKPAPPAKLASLIAIFKLALGDAVKDVRGSDAADRQRGLSGRRRGRHGHASRAAVEAASPARHRGQAHPRTEPAPQTDRAPGRHASARPAPRTSCRNSPGCCSTRRGSSKASSCPTRRPLPAVSPCCSSAACRRRPDRRRRLCGTRRGWRRYSAKGAVSPSGTAT